MTQQHTRARRDQFAVVEEPPPQVLHVPKAKGLLKSREKEAAKAAAAAAEAAAAAALHTVVRIKQLDGLQAAYSCEQARGTLCVCVWGGCLSCGQVFIRGG